MLLASAIKLAMSPFKLVYRRTAACLRDLVASALPRVLVLATLVRRTREALVHASYVCLLV